MFTGQQLARFTQMADQIAQRLGTPFFRHLGNNSAISRHPQAHLDVVRLGDGIVWVGSTDQTASIYRW
ncbi:MAG: alanine racemase [Owenweeksia sp.]|nr:alanine racemase [Owenweeksia sp.]